MATGVPHLSCIHDMLCHEGRSFWVPRLQFERCENVWLWPREDTMSQKGAPTRLEGSGPTLVRADVQPSRKPGLRPHQACFGCI